MAAFASYTHGQKHLRRHRPAAAERGFAEVVRRDDSQSTSDPLQPRRRVPAPLDVNLELG
jgi:hypothetical protein